MLLGAKKPQETEAPTLVTPPWWVNPFYYCLLFLLPFYFITIASSAPYMDKLGQRVNNMTFGNVSLGAASILLFMLGGAPFCLGKNKVVQKAQLDSNSINLALTVMGTLSVFCSLIYFIPVFTNPMLVLKFFMGSSGAMYELRGTLGQVPGITSFMSACLPFLALYSAVTMESGATIITPYNRRLLYAIFFFLLARAVMGSERLALVEGAIAFGVPRATFLWKESKLRTFIPLIGLVAIFFLFCTGEYFRSWQYYKLKYDSFWEFITVRFFGYFSTSINNGAGMITYYPPIGMPSMTVNGFYSLLHVFGIYLDPGTENFGRYLSSYSTPEFNNPGGLYVPYMDYGIAGGLFVFLLMGMLTGFLFKKFLGRRPVGLLLYPSWFLALLDIIRVWIWGNSRFVPVIVVVMLMLAVVKVIPQKGTLLNKPITS